MMQVLVWWVWKPANQNRCPIRAALTAAMAVGATLQIYAMTLGVWLANQSVDAFYDLNTHVQYLIFFTLDAVHARNTVGCPFGAASDLCNAIGGRFCEPRSEDLIPGRIWSIRGTDRDNVHDARVGVWQVGTGRVSTQQQWLRVPGTQYWILVSSRNEKRPAEVSFGGPF